MARQLFFFFYYIYYPEKTVWKRANIVYTLFLFNCSSHLYHRIFDFLIWIPQIDIIKGKI